MADTRTDMDSRVCVYCLYFCEKKAQNYTAHLVIARDGNFTNIEIKIAEIQQSLFRVNRREKLY